MPRYRQSFVYLVAAWLNASQKAAVVCDVTGLSGGVVCNALNNLTGVIRYLVILELTFDMHPVQKGKFLYNAVSNSQKCTKQS